MCCIKDWCDGGKKKRKPPKKNVMTVALALRALLIVALSAAWFLAIASEMPDKSPIRSGPATIRLQPAKILRSFKFARSTNVRKDRAFFISNQLTISVPGAGHPLRIQ